jgi:TolB protein
MLVVQAKVLPPLAQITIESKTGTAYGLAWSPDSETLAVVSGYEITLFNHTLDKPLAMLETPEGAINATWSPDGKQLAFVSGYRHPQVWIADWDAKAGAMSLNATYHGKSGQHQYVVSWSPDGATLATLAQDSEVMIQLWDAETGELGETYTLPYLVPLRALVWSADSTRISGAGWLDDEMTLFTLDLTTGEAVNRMTLPDEAVSFTLSPDEAWVAVGDSDGILQFFDLKRQQLGLSFPADMELDTLVWSRDGKLLAALGYHRALAVWDAVELLPTDPLAGMQMAFISNVSGNFDLYLRDMDSGETTNLTTTPEDEYAPTWSPDGTQIAFLRLVNNDPELFVMDADGSNVRRLTEHPGFDELSDWSPDGKWIAFTSDRDGNEDGFIMDVNGENIRNLTQNPAHDGGLNWSPDGSRLTFTSDREGNADIYIMDGDGENLVNLTADYKGDDTGARWSPDGSMLLFNSERGGNLNIYLMNPDGSDVRQVTRTPLFDLGPVWLPSGGYISFMMGERNKLDIYLADLDGNLQQLTDTPESEGSAAWRPVQQG